MFLQVYDGVNFPAGYDDLKQFEHNNKLSIFVCTIGSDNEVNREYVGNPDYISNEYIHLLRIGDDEKSHYVYIKDFARLINLNRHVSHNDGTLCPFCEKYHTGINMSDHVKSCHKLQFNEGALIKLPEPLTYMEFVNHENQIERPFLLFMLIQKLH